MISTPVYRDPSAWYHIVYKVDTTQATAADRVRIYINGVEITAWATNTPPPQNTDTAVNNNVAHNIGRNTRNSNDYLDGYFAEVNLIDGQALTPTSFGAFDAVTGVWNPIRYSGTYGTNGFYLNFSDPTSTTTIGYDYSGNSNNWTANNISVTAGSTYDSMVDSPTNYGTDTSAGGVVRGNYCVLNPLATGVTLSSGNLNFTGTGTANRSVLSTIAMKTGKWRWEFTPTAPNDNYDPTSGIIKASAVFNPAANEVRYNANAWGVSGTYGGSTLVRSVNNNTFGTSFGWTWTNGDVLGLYFDATNGTLKANQNGGTLATVFTGLTTDIDWLPLFSSGDTTNGTHVTNFGQRAFAYATVDSTYKTLCTQNLTAPTISNGANYMAASLYTGTGVSQTVSNAVNSISFQPDMVWIKSRSANTDHKLTDSVRGATKAWVSNSTAAETTDSTGLTAFGSSGFTVGASTTYNNSGATYVGWGWKGGGTAVTNTSGTVNSSVSANTTAGFSAVTYTGSASAVTVGHGLGVAPSMVIVKALGTPNGTARPSLVYHISVGATKTLYLDRTDAAATTSGPWNDTAPTSTVFSLGTEPSTNWASNNYVAYCFAPISGYSAFGSYTGNGSTDGPFAYCGFRPRFLLMKRSDSTGSWYIWDTSRSPYNQMTLALYPNLNEAEPGGDDIDFLSNGFKIRDTFSYINASGGTYIWAAFAENPFTISRAR